MAWAHRPTAQLVYGLKDSTGSVSTVRFHVPYTTLAAAALTAGDAIRVLFSALSGCTVISQNLTYHHFDDDPATPTLGADIEEKGVFIFRTANGGTTKIEIPGFDKDNLNLSGSINRLAVPVAALTAGMLDVDAIFAGADGSDITSLLKAYFRHRNSTRNMLPSDY